mgnify:CR=1 FL=1
MTELNTVLEGEYKGEKIKKQDNLEIITGDASDKKLVCINKENVESYEIIDETNKKTYSLWKGVLGSMFFPIWGFAAGVGGKKKEAYLISITWKNEKKSLICIDKEWKETLVRGMF